MELADWIGYAAAICTTGAYFPQVVRVVRTRSTRDISLWMCLVLVTGVALWFAFGLMKGEWPIILANGITLASRASSCSTSSDTGEVPCSATGS